jgi:protocatechuate 4,5-dioxygenase, beta chain
MTKAEFQATPWKPFFDAFMPLQHWLADVQPEMVVVLDNDHGLNFFLDKMPTFAVGGAPDDRHADEGWGIPTMGAFPGAPAFSWHLIESLVGEEFDLSTCQEMKGDHAFTLPMALLWPDQHWPVRVVPVCINTVQAPRPSAARCLKLSQAIGRAVTSWPGDEKVLVLGTDGLSHQLDGARAGFINKDFDLRFMHSLAENPAWATQFDTHQPVELAGTQGVDHVDVTGHARRFGTPGAGAAPRLPHCDLEHRLGPDADGNGTDPQPATPTTKPRPGDPRARFCVVAASSAGRCLHWRVDQGLLPPSASASLQLGEQTNCALPNSRRLFSWLRGRCLPHRKHDIVAAPNAPAAVKGEPGVLLR